MKKLLPFLLIACLLWGALPVAAETYESPEDICSDWAKSYVSHARSLTSGHLTPWESEAQDLTLNATPAQFVEYLNILCERIREQAAFDFSLHQVEMTYDELSFPAPAGDTVTREEAAVYFAKIAAHFGMQTGFPALTSFADAEEISPDCRAAVDIVSRMGLFIGDGLGNFDPHRPITREETIAVCIRLNLSDPYPTYKKELGNGTFQRSSFLWTWVEDAEGTLLYAFPCKWITYDYRPDWGIGSMQHITLDGQFVILCGGSRTPEEEDAYYVMDPATMDTLYTFPAELGVFYGVSQDGMHLVFTQTRSSGEIGDFGYSVYGVYDLTGKEVVPMGASSKALKEAGYLAP